MCARVSRDDVDKTVENANGDVIGTVIEVEDGRAVVEPRAGVMDSIRAALGWETANEDTVTIREAEIESISETVIRLEADAEEAAARTDTDADGTDRAGGTDAPDVTADDGRRESDEIGALERDRDVDQGPARDDDPMRIDAGRTADREPNTSPDPVGEQGGVDELHPADETGTGDGATEADDMHPAASDDGAVETDLDDPAPADDSAEADPPTAADERRELEAPSAADELVDTDQRDGLGTTARHDDTRGETAAGSGDELERSATDDATGERDPESAERDGDRGVPDEAASTVDLADERGATDGVPSAEQGRDAESSAREGGSPAADPVDGFDRHTVTDSLEAVSDGLDDQRRRSDEADPADELEMGIDIESAADSGEAADASPTDDRDLADELDRGSDIGSIADHDDAADRDDRASRPTEERDLIDELDRSPDIASVADADRESSVDIEPDAIRGRHADTGDDLETADRRIVTERGSTVDHRPGETAVGGGEQSLESESTAAAIEGAVGDATKADSGESADGSRTTSPLTAMVAVQRAALEPGMRAAEMGVTFQRRSAQAAIAGATAAQRQQRRLVETAASAPLEMAAAMLRAGDDAGPDRESGHRLELVDGLDPLSRKRLVDAGITSLDDLARADSVTVAEAAGVTEKRAANWIEQVTV